MNNSSTIKWRLVWANIWIIGILYLITYIFEDQLFGTHFTAWAFGLFLTLYGVYYYVKTRVYQYFLVGIILGTGYWHYEAAEHMDTIFSMLTMYVHLITFIVVIFLATPQINKALRLELNARKLFRLAAEPVDAMADGYTSRPFSAGKMDYSLQHIIGLGRFLASKDIVRYQTEKDSVTFSFSMNISPLVDTDFTRTSIITFDSKGNISVRVSKQDYNQYRQKLSFDQLCASIAAIFGGFVNAYQNNNENRIIHELKSK